jgi:predicted Fe-S protein YdhL (DUF1289 family)
VEEVREWNQYSSEKKIEVKQECLKRLAGQE